jgi:hypothetical protein
MRRNTVIDNIEESHLVTQPPDLLTQLQPLQPISGKPGFEIDYGYRARHLI